MSLPSTPEGGSPTLNMCMFTRVYLTLLLMRLDRWDTSFACGTWQFCLHNDEPCGFVTFLCVSVATHVTARGVRVITMKRRIRFGSVRG